MALVKCKECGEKISTNAKTCPSCGAKAPKKTSFVTWGVLFIILLAVYGGWQNESNMSPEEKSISALKQNIIEQNKDQMKKERLWVVKGKDAVKARLKDPQSAEFKDVYFFRGGDNIPVTCGQVNTKNSFGGYVGFQYFISSGSSELTFLENEVDDFASVWNKFCTK